MTVVVVAPAIAGVAASVAATDAALAAREAQAPQAAQGSIVGIVRVGGMANTAVPALSGPGVTGVGSAPGVTAMTVGVPVQDPEVSNAAVANSICGAVEYIVGTIAVVVIMWFLTRRD
jgi:hypothetical protein